MSSQGVQAPIRVRGSSERPSTERVPPRTVFRSISRARWAFVAFWLAAAAGSVVLLAGAAPHPVAAGYAAEGSGSALAAAQVRQAFPGLAPAPVYVVLESSAFTADEPAFAAQVAAWQVVMARVAGTVARPAAPVYSADRHTVGIALISSLPPERLTRLAAGLSANRPGGPARAAIGGPAAVALAAESVSQVEALASALRILLPALILVTVLVFGGLTTSLVPVVNGLVSGLVAAGVAGLLAHGQPMTADGLTLAGIVGLTSGTLLALPAAGIMREEARLGAGPTAYLAAAIDSGRVVVLGLAVMVLGFFSLVGSDVPAFRSLGLGGAIGAITGLGTSLTMVPTLLRLGGDRLLRLGFASLERLGEWSPWQLAAASPTTGRKVAVVAGATLLVAGLWSAASLPHLVGAPDHSDSRAETVRAERVAQGLGPAFSSPLTVLAAGLKDPSTASGIQRQLAAAAGSSAIVQGPGDGNGSAWISGPYALYRIRGGPAPDSPAMAGLIDRVGAVAAPASGVTLAVTGTQAIQRDATRAMWGDLTRMALVMILAAMILFLATFRSTLSAVRAALTVPLTAAATAIGLWLAASIPDRMAQVLYLPGWMLGTVPPLTVAVAVALGIAFTAHVLFAIESEVARGDAERDYTLAALLRGGKVVSAAGALGLVAFSTLLFAPSAVFRQAGLAIALALAVDAVLIRLVALPALVAAFGRVDAWPARLQLTRLLPDKAAPSTRVSGRACHHCGGDTVAGAAFCHSCGIRLDDPEALPAHIIDRSTGLYNRRFMLYQITLEVQRSLQFSQPLTVLIFKGVFRSDITAERDPKGLLKEMVTALEGILRSSDMIGVDDPDAPSVIVIMPFTNVLAAALAVERCLAGLRAAATTNIAVVKVGTAVLRGRQAVEAERLLQAAETGLLTGQPQTVD